MERKRREPRRKRKKSWNGGTMGEGGREKGRVEREGENSRANRNVERGNRVAGNLKDFHHSVNFLLKVG